MRKLLCTLLFCAVFNAHGAVVTSPSGKLTARVDVENGAIIYSVAINGRELLKAAPLTLSLSNGVTAGAGIKKYSTATSKDERANQFTIHTRDYDVVFRVFDDAVAYRFVTRFKGEVKVLSEVVEYRFAANDAVLFPEEVSKFTHQERKFIETTIDSIVDGRFCSPPMLASNKGVKILLTEVDLESYPGIYYKKEGAQSFVGDWAYFPLKSEKRGDRYMPVTEYADYMAITSGTRSYPWRVAMVVERDKDLLQSTTLYSLASPSRIEDQSWIEPGKVAWDWWNACNLMGVDFKSGVNTETYKYFVDFAAANDLRYIVLDEGWYDIKKGILDIVPAIDMEQITSYAAEKNVGVILWTTWLALDENMDAAFRQFEKWGIKGLKIDFMQRDDQPMVDWYYKVARKAADVKMLVDYHGAYTPRGLHRTWPNMMTSEGVYGMEQCKWIDDLTPRHNVTLAFTRMILGPMDYTPGAMHNAAAGDFIARFDRPMSIGTRAHQLGMYVVYLSPLQMLADSPTTYQKEDECMQFLREVPTVWDQTVALAGEVGEYVVVARRSGCRWFIGGMAGDKAQTIEVPLDFLPSSHWTIMEWCDGVNVARNAEDFKITTRDVSPQSTITINMGAGGGYAAIIGQH